MHDPAPANSETLTTFAAEVKAITANRRRRIRRADRATSRIAVVDIEYAPALMYSYEAFGELRGPSMLKEPGYMLCAVVMDYATGEVFSFDIRSGFLEMMTGLRDRLAQYEAVVTWNGNRFDEPKINSELDRAGLPMLQPFKRIDLMALSKHRHKNLSNSLGYQATSRGFGAKDNYGGFATIVKVMEGDEKAFDKYLHYCVQDVRLTERLHDDLLGHMPNYPMLASAGGPDDGATCNQCASRRLTVVGDHTAVKKIYALYRCHRCGGHVRGNTIVGSLAEGKGVA